MPGVTLGALTGDLSPPTKDDWLKIGVVEKLYIYPVKSMAAVGVEQLTTGVSGGVVGKLVDRQFMVVDKKGKMVTARRYPNLTLVQPEVGEKELILRYPGVEPCIVSVPRDNSQLKGEEGEVWGEGCEGVSLGTQVGQWISSIILGDSQGGLKLLFHNKDSSSRPDKECDKYLSPLENKDDKPLYADGYPYMLLSQQSVEALNQKLNENDKAGGLQVEETRFRPNIFVSGEFPAFNEDNWKFVKIGESAVFRNVKLCTRCNFTTVNPKTGTKESNGEPLKTLKNFRSPEDAAEKKAYGTSPFFGVNLGLENVGEVKVGDSVWISLNSRQI